MSDGLGRKLPRVKGTRLKDAFVDDGMSEVVTRTFSDVLRCVNERRDFGVVDGVSLRVTLNRLVVLSGFSCVDVDVIVRRLNADLTVDDAFSSGFCSTFSCETSKFRRLKPFESSLTRGLLFRVRKCCVLGTITGSGADA